MKNGIYSVKELNTYIKNILDRDFNLRFVKLEGELSDVKVYSSGHMYFNIIDEESSISAIMFYHDCSLLDFKPKDGDKVYLVGSVSTYVKTGKYQMYVREMYLDGAGAKLLKLQQLKKKLEAEGLFARTHKRKINLYPRAIGIITAKDSAASYDLITNIHRRYPLVDIYTFYSLVQGKEAPKSLINALKLSYKYKLDTLIIGRGGGSNEDLDAFNDEQLVRLAYESPFPIIAAIGHEVDFTLLDFVADARASTPTGAAELSCIDKREIYEYLDNVRYTLESTLTNRIKRVKENLNYLKNRSFFLNPSSLYKDKLNELNCLKDHLTSAFKLYINNKTSDLSLLKMRLQAINPNKVFDRGFALLRHKNGKVIKNVSSVNVGEDIETIVADGKILSRVTHKEKLV